MRCPKCWKEIEQNSKFCIFCGGEIREESKGGRKCPRCGAQNLDQVQYCRTCGASLVQPPAIVRSQPVKTSQPKPAPQTCPSCGSKNDFDAKFCDSCGASLSAKKTPEKCTNCGQLNTSGGIYCQSCGSVLASPVGGAASQLPAESYASEEYETNPIKKAWTPVYENFWEGSSLARSEWGFVTFLALIFMVMVFLIGAASGSWLAAFCVTGVIFLVVTLILALMAYEVRNVVQPSWGEESAEGEAYPEEDTNEE